jgi:hypothetical protein
MSDVKCYANYSNLQWNCSRETVNSIACSYLICYRNLIRYSDYVLQYDVPVTAGPAWCLASNHSNTRLAVSMDYMNIGICFGHIDIDVSV